MVEKKKLAVDDGTEADYRSGQTNVGRFSVIVAVGLFQVNKLHVLP